MNVTTSAASGWLRLAFNLRNSCRRHLAANSRVCFAADAGSGSKKASMRDLHPDLNAVKGRTRKAKPASPYVTLLDTNNETSVVTLEAAEKLASHKSLRLIRETEKTSEGKRETYRLVQASEYFKKAQTSKLRSIGLKGEKAIAIKSHISDHDLAPKLHQIQQWCRKAYQVKVSIDALGDMEKAKQVFSVLETGTKDVGTIGQKQELKAGIRFVLKPLLSDQTENALDQEAPASPAPPS